jgi:phosphoribosyl 1,2-cyclic phosphodiesterase
MRLRFWGGRGSLPTPGATTMRYGGKTLCVELRCGPHLLILDAGSGLRELGAALAPPVDADILLSHTHLNHIFGLPFFAPMFDQAAQLRFWAGHLAPPAGIAAALALGWSAPLMPDIGAEFRARRAFHVFAPGDHLSLRPGLRVRTAPLRHPGNATGYRIEWAGATVCYITDTEHPAIGLDEALLRFVAGADVMIYDAQDTDAEYSSRVGWGHSTWQAGVALADAAGVGQLVLFHHDPGHDDEAMDATVYAADRRRPGTLAAQEGMSIVVTPPAAPVPHSRAAG